MDWREVGQAQYFYKAQAGLVQLGSVPSLGQKYYDFVALFDAVPEHGRLRRSTQRGYAGRAELASFEDLTVLVRDGEPFTPAVVFFPMHRIERVELDLPDGNLPSLSQRFLNKTGLEPSAILRPQDRDAAPAEQSPAKSRARKERA